MRRCRSTTGSAAPPGSTAPPRWRPRRPARCSTARSRCASTPMSRPALPWRFVPEAERDRCAHRRGRHRALHGDQSGRARDRGVRPPTTSTPLTVGIYFQKINCFCFTEQTLKPRREARRWPVVFYVDPALAKDSEHDGLNTITLSYTFYPKREPATAGGGHRTSRSRTGERDPRNSARRLSDAALEDDLTDGRRAMADAHAKHHDYHLVNPSPWPVVGSVVGLRHGGRRHHLDAQDVRRGAAGLRAPA